MRGFVLGRSVWGDRGCSGSSRRNFGEGRGFPTPFRPLAAVAKPTERVLRTHERARKYIEILLGFFLAELSNFSPEAGDVRVLVVCLFAFRSKRSPVQSGTFSFVLWRDADRYLTSAHYSNERSQKTAMSAPCGGGTSLPSVTIDCRAKTGV